ncbi:MAG: P-II family nitrogen regulator [Methanosarcinales archaeon]
MKMILAVFRPEKLEKVTKALSEIGIVSLTVSSVQGRGMQRGIVQKWKDKEYSVDLLNKTELMTVVEDSKVDKTIDTIVEAARTGQIGDGKIFVLPVENAIKIRTGEKDHNALQGLNEV